MPDIFMIYGPQIVGLISIFLFILFLYFITLWFFKKQLDQKDYKALKKNLTLGLGAVYLTVIIIIGIFSMTRLYVNTGPRKNIESNVFQKIEEKQLKEQQKE